jgi:hypothetical protein
LKTRTEDNRRTLLVEFTIDTLKVEKQFLTPIHVFGHPDCSGLMLLLKPNQVRKPFLSAVL